LETTRISIEGILICPASWAENSKLSNKLKREQSIKTQPHPSMLWASQTFPNVFWTAGFT
jgi:hypothetical protein